MKLVKCLAVVTGEHYLAVPFNGRLPMKRVTHCRLEVDRYSCSTLQRASTNETRLIAALTSLHPKLAVPFNGRLPMKPGITHMHNDIHIASCSTLQRASTNETRQDIACRSYVYCSCSTLQRASTNETARMAEAACRLAMRLAVPFNGRLPMKPLSRVARASCITHLAVPFNGRLPMKHEHLAMQAGSRYYSCSTLQRASTNETAGTLNL